MSFDRNCSFPERKKKAFLPPGEVTDKMDEVTDYLLKKMYIGVYKIMNICIVLSFFLSFFFLQNMRTSEKPEPKNITNVTWLLPAEPALNFLSVKTRRGGIVFPPPRQRVAASCDTPREGHGA